MRGKRIVPACVILVCMVISIPSSSDAQVIGGLILERYGVLNTPGTGARPFAMGGAYTAISDDAFALLFNPAGLAQIKRKEVAFGFHHTRNDLTNKYLDARSEQINSYTSLSHVTAVYPYPTYRGSFVLGFGVFRVGSSDFEYLKKGDLSATTLAENAYIQSGNIYQYHIGAGIDISPRLSIGASLAIWDESINYTEEIVYADPGSLAVWTDDVKMNLDGVSINAGLLIRITEEIRAGLMVSSPTWLAYNGDGITYREGEYFTGPYDYWEYESEYGIIEEEFTLPMKFRGGLSLSIDPVLLSADVSYVDYSQTKWWGQPLVDEFDPSGGHVLKEAWNLNVGAEVSLPQYPIRIRGGYCYSPLALSTIEEISYLEDFYDPTTIVADFDIIKNRQFVTFGIGGLIDRVFMIDVGAAIGGFERDTGDLSEKREIIELLLSGAYRF